MARLTAREAIEAVADHGTFDPWPAPEVAGHADSGYRADLERAGSGTGSDESVLGGELHIGGHRAAVLAWEFGFLGGSVGVATAARIVAVIRRASAEGLALLSVPRSGGTRMQEGTPAFTQMVAIAGALAEHRAAGLPHLVHLCSPTTGGVLATLGSAGDVTTAEPDAMIGFLGPRAFQAITGMTFPEGVQTAENLCEHGLVDAVLDWPSLRRTWTTLVGLWADRPARSVSSGSSGWGGEPAWHRSGGAASDAVARPHDSPIGAPDGPSQLWDYVLATRRHDRVDAGDFITTNLTDLIVLPGTGAGEPASGAMVALGRLGGTPVVVAGTIDRRSGQPLTVGGMRTIRRGIALAARWGLPVVTVVDTLGAQLSVQGEQSGIAGEISRVMVDLVAAPIPTVSVLLGAGTGGAALALLATDRIVAGSHAWVAPLAPEGAAAIRHDGSHDPAEVAWTQRIGVHALAELGLVDRIVRESEHTWVRTLAAEAGDALGEVLAGVDPRRRVERFVAWPT